MIEFATAIYVMDAGPSQAVEKTCKIFGLSNTAKIALTNRVHGPRQGGATFLAQFATKEGVNVQLLTLTLGRLNYGHLVQRQKMHLLEMNYIVI